MDANPIKLHLKHNQKTKLKKKSHPCIKDLKDKTLKSIMSSQARPSPETQQLKLKVFQPLFLLLFQTLFIFDVLSWRCGRKPSDLLWQ